MEGLMLLGVLVVIAALCTPIIAIIAFARAGDARRRVEALEFNVADLRARLARGESMEADPAAAAPSMVPPEAVPLGMPPAQQAPYAA
ncbi:MAG: hypothetical protein JNL07_04505, partial [Rhodospirillales bacterium]|nr:hypothetical protein [Rhodospirillales bacterium]